MPTRWETIRVRSFLELVEREREILARIAKTPHGGNLFMIHPLMLLSDVGVELSREVVHELLEREPHLAALSATPYTALKASQEEQRIRFNVRGLFRREPT